MRHIGHLPNDQLAHLFGDFLVSRGIRNEVEHESDNSWSIWIHDEDQVGPAHEWLKRFAADPNTAEFRDAREGAEKARKAEAESLADYQRRVRTRRSLFPKFGGYGVGVLTYVLIAVCGVVAFYSKVGMDMEAVHKLFISEVYGHRLPEVFGGEVWRIVTPIFVHNGPLHLIFNMMWLYQLGCMIESRMSSLYLAALVLVSAAVSNLAQYYLVDPAFCGMSGVVYALAGFVWMRGKYDHSSGVGLNSQTVTILLIWLVVCYAGIVPGIANTVHIAGLLVGMAWGRISAWFAAARPD